MVGRRADLQATADIFDAFAASQLFVGRLNFLMTSSGVCRFLFMRMRRRLRAAKLSYHLDQFTGSTPVVAMLKWNELLFKWEMAAGNCKSSP
jgi:hypothetical protein